MGKELGERLRGESGDAKSGEEAILFRVLKLWMEWSVDFVRLQLVSLEELIAVRVFVFVLDFPLW